MPVKLTMNGIERKTIIVLQKLEITEKGSTKQEEI